MDMKKKSAATNPGLGDPAWRMPSLADALLPPQPVNSPAFEQIRSQLDGRGSANSPQALMKMLSRPSCPDAVIAEIIRTNSAGKIPQLKKALDKLNDVGKFAFPALGNVSIAAMFVQRPEIIVAALGRITRAAGESAWCVFVPFENNREMAELFAKNPDAFAKIAEHIGEDKVRPALERLGSLAALFTQKPDAFVDIAKYARDNTWEAFAALHDEKLAARFGRNPDEFVRIAKRKGDETGDAFQELSK